MVDSGTTFEPVSIVVVLVVVVFVVALVVVVVVAVVCSCIKTIRYSNSCCSQ